MQIERLVALLAVALIGMVMLPVAGFAEPPVGDDLLGIYSAPDGCGQDHIDLAAGAFTVHLCITGITCPDAIDGWECAIGCSGELALISMDLKGGTNLATFPEFAIGMPAPLYPSGDLIDLASLTFLFAGGLAYLYLHPLSDPTLPGCMTYHPDSTGAEPVCLGWSSGKQSRPVFGINSGPLGIVIPTAGKSWGAVKALFR
jgi:hypothetical protein